MTRGLRMFRTALLIALIGGARAAALSQTTLVEPQAAIHDQGAPTLPSVRARLAEVGRRLREAKLASYSSPLPQEDYIEAQREIARGDYREAIDHLSQADQELDGVPNYTAPTFTRR
jgi:hypothetical protein